MLKTPPKLPTLLFAQNVETPGPTKARINHLQSQVSELVRKNQALERKIQAEKSLHSTTVVDKNEEILEIKAKLKISQKELERCKSEGDGMRDELQLHSMVQQQKALLALAQEQMQVVELEQRLVNAEKARIMRDHKISLFQAKEEDLIAELKERDQIIMSLESKLSKTNSSLTQLQTSSSLSTSSTTKELISTQKELSLSKNETSKLEEKIDVLENKIKVLKESEKEKQNELNNWLKDEKSKLTNSEKNKQEFSNQIKSLENDLNRKTEEFNEFEEEFEEFKKSTKEREKSLKLKLRESNEERDRLLGIEEELHSLKSNKSKTMIIQNNSTSTPSSPKKATVKEKEKVRKTSPVQDESSDEDVDVPKKKAKKAQSPVKQPKPKSRPTPIASPSTSESESETITTTKAPVKRAKSPVKSKKIPLETSDVDNQPLNKVKTTTTSKKVVEVPAPSPEPEDTVNKATAVPKKKKRLLGGVKSTFEWDPIMGSGDGVIPIGLSPMKPITGKAVGTIPRAGFSAASRLNRLG
ncbi:uncharacterized protein L201_002652 [Kwoniella dendrophila CBS 6074]|uniref:Uncharacterized protein n=1 Tax=Kwoniella dendrophila CBS 6074 TaxID=1295534 RepID=A0AAX4JQS3_9TREE